MNTYFTPSRKGLSNIPLAEDSVLLTPEEAATIIAALAEGKVLGVDLEGKFTLEYAPYKPTADEEFSQLPIATKVAIKLGRLNADYDVAVAILNSGYPTSETHTWTLQVSEARIYMDWLNSDRKEKEPRVHFLNQLHQGREAAGIDGDLEDLVQKVLYNDSVYSPALASFTAYRHGMEKAIRTAAYLADEATLDAITWEFEQPDPAPDV